MRIRCPTASRFYLRQPRMEQWRLHLVSIRNYHKAMSRSKLGICFRSPINCSMFNNVQCWTRRLCTGHDHDSEHGTEIEKHCLLPSSSIFDIFRIYKGDEMDRDLWHALPIRLEEVEIITANYCNTVCDPISMLRQCSLSSDPYSPSSCRPEYFWWCNDLCPLYHFMPVWLASLMCLNSLKELRKTCRYAIYCMKFSHANSLSTEALLDPGSAPLGIPILRVRQKVACEHSLTCVVLGKLWFLK